MVEGLYPEELDQIMIPAMRADLLPFDKEAKLLPGTPPPASQRMRSSALGSTQQGTIEDGDSYDWTITAM